jgi:hypothetical protein
MMFIHSKTPNAPPSSRRGQNPPSAVQSRAPRRSGHLALLTLAAFTGLSLPASAIESIGWSYDLDGATNDALTSVEVAGAPTFEQANWNNHKGNSGTGLQGVGKVPFALLKNDGSTIPTRVTSWVTTPVNSWRQGYVGSDPNGKLMNAYNAEEITITFGDIPEDFQEDGYKLVVYYTSRGSAANTFAVAGLDSDNVSKTRSVRAGTNAGTNWGTVGYKQATDDNVAGPDQTNYTVLEGFSGKDLQVTFRNPSSITGSARSATGITAIQIVKAEGAPMEPSAVFPRDDDGYTYSPGTNLVWKGGRATEYDVYLWSENEDEPETPTATVSTKSYTPTTALEPETYYFWRVVGKSLEGEAGSSTFAFLTGVGGYPEPIYDFPYPLDEQTNVPLTQSLVWDPANDTAEYHLYIWEQGQTAGSPIVTDSPFGLALPNPFKPATTYHWRVDTVNEVGVTPGPEWTFSTVDQADFGRPSIGWHFDGNYSSASANNTLLLTDLAGAPGFAQRNWNNHINNGDRAPVTGYPFALIDNTGGTSTMKLVSWTTSGNNWGHGYTVADTNDKLMLNYTGKHPSMAFADIPQDYQESGYTVVVYYGTTAAALTNKVISIIGSNDDLKARTVRFGAASTYKTAGFVEATDASNTTTGPATNYTVFRGLNDPHFQIVFSTVANDDGGISGVQIVKDIPSTSSPVHGAAAAAPDLAFSWNVVPTATSYNLYVWKQSDPAPTTPTASGLTSLTYDPPSNLDEMTAYYWRVDTVHPDGVGTGTRWAFSTDSNDPAAQATSPTPADDAIDILPSTTLTWAAAPRSASYSVSLWKAGQTPVPVTTLDPSFTPAAPLELSTEYFWRVDTVNSQGTTTGIEWSFTVGSLPGIPGNPSPAVDQVVDRVFQKLDWADVSGATSYRVFAWPATGTAPATPTSVVAKSEFLQPAIYNASTTYSWRIEAVNVFGTTVGPTWTFTTTDQLASAKSIGWKFHYASGSIMAASDVAGAPGARQSNWNSKESTGQGVGALFPDLIDSTGATTTASLSAWTQATTGHSYRYYLGAVPSPYNGLVPSSDSKLTNSFILREPSLTFSGIPYATYDVVVYYGNNEGGGASTLSIANEGTPVASRSVNTGGNFGNSQNGPFVIAPYNAGYVEALEDTPDTTKTNYTVFRNVSGSSLTVSITGINVGLSAVQFVQVGTGGGDPFTDWATITKGLSGPAAAFDADPDNDGIKNGIEFLLGGEPNPTHGNSNSNSLLPKLAVEEDEVTFTFDRTHASSSIEAIVEFSLTLDGVWETAVDGENATIDIAEGVDSDTITVTIPKNGEEKLFVRLRALEPAGS